MDAHAQIIGERLGKVLGQPAIRIHKPGAGAYWPPPSRPRPKQTVTACSRGLQAILIMPSILKKVDYTWEDFIPWGCIAGGSSTST